MILEATANANGGLCAHCSKGGGICEVCGKRMSQPNKSGMFVCWDCEKSQRIERIPSLPKQWTQFGDVDWQVVANNYALGIDPVLRQFLTAQGQDPAYGVVFQLSQNGMLDVHINTEGGIKEIPERMRKIANWGQELTDEGWIAEVGIWYTPAWKYGGLGSVFENEEARAIDDFHYDLFERLHDSGGSGGIEEISARFDESRLSAINVVRNSNTYGSILKTNDFAAYVADDEGLDYHSKERIGA